MNARVGATGVGGREDGTEAKKLIGELEAGLDTRNPGSSGDLQVRILGYGEVSTVFGIGFPDGSYRACKRMPLFSSAGQAEEYVELYRCYNRLLEDAGLKVPGYDGVTVPGQSRIFVNYLFQEPVARSSVCNMLLAVLPREAKTALILKIVREAAKVWDYNRSGGPIQLGLDGQLSNWALMDRDKPSGSGFEEDAAPDVFCPDATEYIAHADLYFLDSSTPFIRRQGVEQIDRTLLLKSAPGLLQPLLAKLFLADVIGRYYSFRSVLVDLLANLHKEQHPEIINPALETVNRFLSEERGDLGIAKLQRSEIDAYYKEDKFIWNLYMAVRKLDRFLRTQILRKRYEFILPGPIRR